MEGIGVIGRVADDVVKEAGIVQGAKLAPILACTLAHNAREQRNSMLQSGVGALREPVPGPLLRGAPCPRVTKRCAAFRLVPK
jgi:hypothetical protein